MRLGENVFQIALTENLTEYTFEANLTQSANLLCFDNIDITTKRKPEDPRTLGIGLSQISITGNEVPDTLSAERIVKNDIGLDKAPRLINVSGVVYTSVLNPNDSRKNWEDILTGFCLAFRDNNNATLILKMNYKDLTGYIDDVFALFRQLSPFKCRVLIIHGFLDTASYNSLIEISSFAVNSSRGEGQCLPLMEYMSSGVPALAPNNTAMGDYVSAANTFIIESSPEPIFWPHDPQQTIRTLWYRPSWESLYNCYLDSYEIATTNPVKYREMSEQAYKSLHSFCSTDILKQRLLDFTNTMAIT
jgi:glycosyltransferase involved in cell wall biosynthesis